jgi:hypothetical protein
MKPFVFSLVFAAVVLTACEEPGRPTEERAARPNGPQFDQTPLPPQGRPAGFIGATFIALQNQVVGIDNIKFRAFISTGSTSTNCLATLAESNTPRAAMSLFCGPRTLNGVDGVLVSIFFDTPVPSDALVTITLYQDGAKSYGTPVPFTGD